MTSSSISRGSPPFSATRASVPLPAGRRDLTESWGPRRKIKSLVDDRTAAVYELGLNNLQLSPGGGALPDKERVFEAGLLDLRRRQGLYSENGHGIETSGGVLYRATITIPSQVPVGDYTAETFLIDNGKVVAAATRMVVRPWGRATTTVAMAPIVTTAARAAGQRRRRRTGRRGARTRGEPGSTTGRFAAAGRRSYMRAAAKTWRTRGSKCSSGRVS